MDIDEKPARGMLSIEQFCDWANIGRTTFYEEMGTGRLVVRKVGRRRLVTMPDAIAWRDKLPSASIMEAA